MTIYDIAKKAGVSASTVSRVVNNKPGIKPATREKIERLLEEYGYTPNEAARGLVKKASGLIGILIADIRYSHYMDIAYFVGEELGKAGYCCLMVYTGTSDEKKVEAIKMLEQRRIQGLIAVGSIFQCEAVEKALASSFPEIPITMANGYLPLPNVKGVLVDERNGVAECIRLMIKRGHQKIAFVIPNQTPSNLQKQKGYEEAMEENGWNREELWIYHSPTTIRDGYEVTVRILKEHPDLEGIFFCEDMAAASSIRALTDAGLSVPEQVAVIGVDDTMYCEICNPKLTSLDNMMLDMSMESARILLDSLEGKSNPSKIMLFSRIIEREST